MHASEHTACPVGTSLSWGIHPTRHPTSEKATRRNRTRGTISKHPLIAKSQTRPDSPPAFKPLQGSASLCSACPSEYPPSIRNRHSTTQVSHEAALTAPRGTTSVPVGQVYCTIHGAEPRTLHPNTVPVGVTKPTVIESVVMSIWKSGKTSESSKSSTHRRHHVMTHCC